MQKINVSFANIAISLAFFLCLISPYLGYTGHGLRNSWVAFFLWLLTLPFQKVTVRQAFVLGLIKRKVEFSFLSLWLLIVVSNAILNRGYTADLHLLTMITMVMILLMACFFSSQKDGSSDLIVVLSLMCVGVEIGRSLPVLWANPALPRMIMSLSVSPELTEFAGTNSVGQYGHYTGMAIVLPVIVSRALMSKRFLKIALLGVTWIIVLAISMSTFMGAILLMVLGYILLAVAQSVASSTKKSVIKFVAYGIAIVAFIVVWMSFLKNTEQGIYIEEKIVNQVLAVESDGVVDGDKTKRAELWVSTLETIADYPLFGIGPSTNRDNPNLGTYVSGHSSLLDQTAEYGFIGFGTYILFFASATKRLWRAFKAESVDSHNRTLYLASLVCCLVFVVAGSYNPTVIITETLTFFYFIIFCGEA